MLCWVKSWRKTGRLSPMRGIEFLSDKVTEVSGSHIRDDHRLAYINLLPCLLFGKFMIHRPVQISQQHGRGS